LGTPKFSVSSLEEIEFMDIQSMCPPVEYDHRNKSSYSEQPHALTVVIGAVCQEGIVLVADNKITNAVGGKDENDRIKIYGDLGHILIGYTGALSSDLPPSCKICGSYLRPDVVWFGESLEGSSKAIYDL
jgi:hypothetical protein